MELGRRNFIRNAYVFWLSLPWLGSSCAKTGAFSNASAKLEVNGTLASSSKKLKSYKLSCSLNANGSKCVFPRIDNNEVSIALVDFNAATYDNFALPTNIGSIEDISISRDGKRIAFVAREEFPNRSEMDIWVIDVEGRVEFILTGEGRIKQKPAFSPDGRKLAFFADMRHQYLGGTEYDRGIDSPASMAVHELDLESEKIRLLDMPILPGPSESFYSDNEILIASWNFPIEDFADLKLPVNCDCGISIKNSWQRFPTRFQETIGQVNLSDGLNGKFEKFDIQLPRFNSVRDSFYLSSSPCENGFLAVLYLWDPVYDPTPELLQHPRYYPGDIPKIGLSWLFNDGNRSDFELPSDFTGIPFSCGSFDRSRVVVWAGLNDKAAIESKFPWTKELDADWQILDLYNKYKIENSFEMKSSEKTRKIEVPKLFDRNGVGKTFETQFHN